MNNENIYNIYNEDISFFDVTLRKIYYSDLNMICMWRNDYNVKKYMDDRREVSVSVLTVWLNKIMNSSNSAAFIILDKNSKKSGVLELKNIDLDKSCCEQGIFLAPDNIGSGIGTSTTLCQEYVLEFFGISTVYITIRNDNIRNINFWKKLGAITIDSNSEFTKFKSEKYVRRERLRQIACKLNKDNVWDSIFNKKLNEYEGINL